MSHKPLLGPCDSYQLEPFAYPWAWEMSRQQENNSWVPEEIAVAPDVADYKNPALDPKHKHLFESVMAQLTTFDILRGDEIAETLQPIMQPAEIKHFLKRMAWDECVIEGTEVLTPRGWVAVELLAPIDKVLQWAPDHKMEWVTPTHISKNVRGSYYVVSSPNDFYQRVTAGHRVPYFSDTGNLLVTTADKLKSNVHAKHPLTGVFIGEGRQHLNNYERFLIALQADGHIHRPDSYTGERCGTVPVNFTFSKLRKQQRLESILQALGWAWTFYMSPGKGNVMERKNYRVSVPIEHTLDKSLAVLFKIDGISKSWAEEFIDEVSHWDAHRVPSYDRVEYFSTDKSSADTVQAIATLAGYRTKQVARADYREDRYKDSYWVYIHLAKTYIRGLSLQKNLVEAPAVFYGIEVPSSFILIRDNGRVSITGNSLHTRSYRFVIENLGIPLEIYTRYNSVPEFRARVDMCEALSRPLLTILGRVYRGTDALHNLSHPQKQDILRSMIFYFLIFEGVWFWMSLLGPIQQLSRLGVFRGAAEQFSYIARDEQQHVGFGVQLIREFMDQHPECVTEEFMEQIYSDVNHAIKLEADYISHCLKDGPILGYSVTDHVATAKFFANLRLCSVGLATQFPDAYHAFPWMSEAMELKKEKNFFETRVTEYQSGGALSFDEDGHDGWSDPLAGLRTP